MNIEKIEEFVTDYLDQEYFHTQNKYDVNISDDDHETQVDKFLKKYLYTSLHDYHSGLDSRIVIKVKSNEEIERLKNNFKKRKLFLIQEYKNPTYGDGLDYDAKPENPLFVAYVSTEYDSTRDGTYFMGLHITLVEGEYRIAAIGFVDGIEDKNQVIMNDFSMDEVVEDLGTLVQSKKIQAPTEEPYLSHYNSVV